MFVECGQCKYSKSGYEPCKVCPRDTYQDSHGETSCISCPKGGKTWFRGADGDELCWGMILFACKVIKLYTCVCIDTFVECGQGKYSKSGYEPCKVCPRDTYQDSHGETSCISCPKGGKTWFRGADGDELCWGMILFACKVIKLYTCVCIDTILLCFKIYL